MYICLFSSIIVTHRKFGSSDITKFTGYKRCTWKYDLKGFHIKMSTDRKKPCRNFLKWHSRVRWSADPPSRWCCHFKKSLSVPLQRVNWFHMVILIPASEGKGLKWLPHAPPKLLKGEESLVREKPRVILAADLDSQHMLFFPCALEFLYRKGMCAVTYKPVWVGTD